MVKPKYKVGDEIVGDAGTGTRSGKLGIVAWVNPDRRAWERSGETRYIVSWIGERLNAQPDISHYKSEWLEDNTTLVSRKPEDRGRYMCVVEGSSTPPKVEHITELDAREEAERLAERHGGTVRVLQVIASVKMKKKIQYIPDWDNE
ncbi:hypothetical protein NOX27_24820 [Enterobacter kobei]|uniref:hypothetical protein n=1 Tax=Enterobacter kobei TaxID=208224 RepID=UPI00210A7C84|nr:hypothetical protein [Enterobacter kobei]MCQ4359528.1 hypothetical protein [Enterobacter kobei]HDC4425516.1 hypothetical protein [Enterobacter kobei]HDC4630206.1 hypothetical protein [Enterobacter kobei]HDC4671438.1 hypothetical protein [Enterobacter kobei]